MTKLEAALIYAIWGWHVLPVVENGKIPATAHGVKDATVNTEQIKKWWTQNPNYNIGIATGKLSGIIVFDVDPRNGGTESWELWQEKYGKVPSGAMQITARNGCHYISKYIDGIGSCKLAEGVDLLSDGRYFLVYPSDIEGVTYQWEISSDPFEGSAPFDMPSAWIDAYKNRLSLSQKTDLSILKQGQRNDGLTALAGAMRRYGMTEAEIMAAISIANELRCEIPLPSSEITQIVKSVCRYEPDFDIAIDDVIGKDSVEAILHDEQTHEYYFTRATSYLKQPSPIPWVIKNWIPDYALTMIYGESGAGKSFLALDMACHIALGIPWLGHKVKQGNVLFLAGEGNFGIRQRIAAWCKDHNVDKIDDLLISNKAIALDVPQAPAQVLSAAKELTDKNISIYFIDTVNAHMIGDENSAKDVRIMINNCLIIARASNAAVCLIHHIGHSTEAKDRARGSSAWKASLDASILVMKKDDNIKIKCVKMKDAKEPDDIQGVLKVVDLGWKDEDDNDLTGAIFTVNDKTNYSNQKSIEEEQKYNDDIKKFSNAWWHSGAEVINDYPYITKSALIDYLIQNDGYSITSAKQLIKHSAKGKLIYNLLNSEVIKQYKDGWIIINNELITQLLIRKNNS